MKLLVLGASRGIGALAVAQAAEAGHEVRAFARTADALEARAGVTPMTGDALKLSDLAPAVAGVDAVISAIGLGRDPRRFVMPTTLFSETGQAMMTAMVEAGVDRLLVVTGFGAGDSIKAMSMLERIGHRAILGRAYADKDKQEEQIRASALTWTLVRPVILSDGARTGKYKVLDDPATWRNGLISRADVADYLIRAAEEGLNPRQAVVLTR